MKALTNVQCIVASQLMTGDSQPALRLYQWQPTPGPARTTTGEVGNCPPRSRSSRRTLGFWFLTDQAGFAEAERGPGAFHAPGRITRSLICRGQARGPGPDTGSRIPSPKRVCS